jgi:hypothetical protein
LCLEYHLLVNVSAAAFIYHTATEIIKGLSHSFLIAYSLRVNLTFLAVAVDSFVIAEKLG